MSSGWSDSPGPWGAPTWKETKPPTTRLPKITMVCIVFAIIVGVLILWGRYA